MLKKHGGVIFLSAGLLVQNLICIIYKEQSLLSTIHKILSNEKYIGDALLQKTITTNLLEKKREINNGLAPQYYKRVFLKDFVTLEVTKMWKCDCSGHSKKSHESI